VAYAALASFALRSGQYTLLEGVISMVPRLKLKCCRLACLHPFGTWFFDSQLEVLASENSKAIRIISVESL